MKEALSYIHAHIYDLRQIRKLRRLFKSIVLFEYLYLVGLPFIFGTAAGEIYPQLQSGFAECRFIVVLFESFSGFNVEHHVIGL